MSKFDLQSLYYITHIKNLPSILQKGILSHQKITDLGLSPQTIYDGEIVNHRQNIATPEGRSLWDYANLYFQHRNAMLYRLIQTTLKELAVIGVKAQVIHQNGVVITDGNAASNETQFFAVKEGLNILKKQWSIIQNEWWKKEDGSTRKMMAECLVPNQISPDFIHSIYVVNNKVKQQLEKDSVSGSIPIISEPKMFFHPHKIASFDNISLIDGDMFFSNLQTLTISVNLQGVMGKGLASRAKYQFPDVYVYYQDACKNKQITATTPHLYKREASIYEELADLPSSPPLANGVKWFLLFATKRKWRENSRLEDIEAGLNWIKNNYQQLGIKSLAIPALGCGLGNLQWREVGPLMVRYLHGLEIRVAIYLPRENIPQGEFLRKDFLLSSGGEV